MREQELRSRAADRLVAIADAIRRGETPDGVEWMYQDAEGLHNNDTPGCAVEARDWAQESLQPEDGSWPENTNWVGWGVSVFVDRAAESNRRDPPADHPVEVSYFCDYGLEPIGDEL